MSTSSPALERPEFAITLGILPPYAIEDVKRAYLEKVKNAHPDHGGNRSDFEKIQHAYEQALEYLRFRSDRREWIAARMEEYLAVVALLERLQSLGADADTVMPDWVKRSFGDFADLTEAITSIRLVDSDKVSNLIDALVRDQAILPALGRLDLSGCPIDDAMVFQLRVFKRLNHLNLSRTAISDRSLAIVEWLPALVDLKIEGTSVGWWAQFKLRRLLRRRQATTLNPLLHPVNVR
jgi:hypothetical protein